MKQEIPWTKLSVEAFVIIASILLAFAIDAWWDDFQDRNIEQLYLSRIATDLSRGQSQLDSVTRDINVAMQGASALIQGLEGEGGSLEGDISIAQEFGNAARLAQLQVQAATDHATTYRELISTGRLNLIRDVELRSSISSYYERIEEIEDMRSKIPLDIMVRFRELTGVHPSQIRAAGGLSDDQIRLLVSEATEDPNVIREARYLYSILVFAGPNYERAMENNQALLDRVN